MSFTLEGSAAREVQEALKNYIRDNVTKPLSADQTLKSTVVGDLNKRTKAIGETSKQVSDLGKTMEAVSKRGIKELTNSLFDLSKGTKTAKGLLKKELASLTQDLLEVMASNIRITQNPASGTSSSKDGGVFGGILDFASGLLGFRAGGGAVASGQAFVVGERGPELLVTGRTAGQVVANGGSSGAGGGSSGVNVTVVNNAGADVSVQQKQRSNGTRELEILVDTMVAQSLTRGNSKAFQALGATYGLRPILNGR